MPTAALTLTGVLLIGHFIASPYLGPLGAGSEDLTVEFAEGAALDAAERGTPPDDTPTGAAQIPGLREAIAATRFDVAADILVAFAIEHPKASEAGWALRRAYLYSRALGRDTEHIVRRYEKLHAAHEPRAAALFFWSRREDLGEAGPRRAHVRRYLAVHAAHGPPDLRIAAEAELAASLWQDSCTAPLHGLCIAEVPTRREGACNPGEVPLFKVLPRAPEMRREALRRAAAAKKLGGPLDLAHVAPWRRPALRAALGEAALVTADAAIEDLIALEFPQNLEFFVEDYKHNSGVPKWEQEYREQRRHAAVSHRLAARYFTAFQRRGTAASLQTATVGETRSGPAMLRGLAHLAVAFAELDDERELASAPPKQFGPDVWCEPADPYLHERTLDLLTACASMARLGVVTGPEVELCMGGLGRHYTEEPALAEFTGSTPAARP